MTTVEACTAVVVSKLPPWRTVACGLPAEDHIHDLDDSGRPLLGAHRFQPRKAPRA